MAEPLWTSHEACEATGGRMAGTWAVKGVSIDTRSLKPGDLFVALKDVRDGHEFVPQAFAAGAEAALVSRDVLGAHPGLIVGDVLEGLEKLGLAARVRSNAKCVAVTGSVGKTSVKEMLARIFRAAGRAHWSDKSFNNHWGVPLTLARMPKDTERAVFEIGMNTPGEIAPRSRMVRPHVALITRVSPAHLEGMGTVEAVANEKADIFAGLEPCGTAILPAADQFFERMKAKALKHRPDARILAYGVGDGLAAGVIDYETDGVSSLATVDVQGVRVSVTLEAVGSHWASNAALALLAASLCGVDVKVAAAALAGYAPPAGRGVAETLRLADGGEVTLVDDAYNANPDSMRAAVEGFASRPGRKLVVLGEMRELGSGSADLHASLARPLSDTGVAVAILSGGEMRHLESALARANPGIDVQFVERAEDAAAVLQKRLRSGDIILVKGSNASGMSKVSAALRASSEAVRKAGA
jgi:UDP-N-acetylmuramoyl-tripeptide--D-alanyl-D-alanine ligase